jgi:hypothetical protein
MAHIPEELRQALLERSVVPFVGAGVSREVRRRDGSEVFCGWTDVLRRAEAVARVKDAEGADVVAAQLKRGKHEKAAAEAKDCLGTAWVRFLEKEFAPEYGSIDPASLELAWQLWRVG